MKFISKTASVWYGHSLGVGLAVELEGGLAEKALRMPHMFEPVEAPKRGRPRKVSADEDAN